MLGPEDLAQGVRALAALAGALGFTPQHPCKKLVRETLTFNPSTVGSRGRKGGGACRLPV